MKIVAIGGGNYSLDDETKPYNVEKINQEIVKLANKNHPRLLNIGFNIRSDYYYSFIKKIFSSFGCQCEYLRFNEFDNVKTVEGKFKRADIIFLPGGNTLNYMKQVKSHLEKAGYRNSGVSLTRVVDEDGNRSYEMVLHHKNMYKLSEAEQEIMLEEIEQMAFHVSGCKFRVKLLS